MINRYHPGFIVKFLEECEKLPWADTICLRLNMGNPFHSEDVDLPFDVSTCPKVGAKYWTMVKVKDLDNPELMMRNHFPIPVSTTG